jgi:hypothetical protein
MYLLRSARIGIPSSDLRLVVLQAVQGDLPKGDPS